MVNTVHMWDNADHGRHFHPVADHMTKLGNFTKEKNREQALTNLIVRLMI